MNKRPVCPNCEFIEARCICNWITSIHNQTNIIILQHPTESRHALNTVRLMNKSLVNIKIFIGENFTEHLELNLILDQFKNSIALIFPNENNPNISVSKNQKLTHLILIDSTWKKAYKIFKSSINLHLLQSYSLPTIGKSAYKIRSTSIENGLSTLEATINALAIIENNLDTTSLKECFDKMIEFQIEKMGQEIFQKNYALKTKKNDNDDH